jgi:hypothetical protein
MGVEVQLPQQRLHTCTFVIWQRLTRKPVPPGLAEQIRHRRRRGEVTRQDRVHLILQPSPLTHHVSTAHHLTAQTAGPIIGQPHRRQEIRSQQLRQDPRIDLVGLHLRLGDRPRLRRVRHHHTRHQRGE